MSELTLLDGGMGQELVARAGKATGLWSVQALLDTPDMVRAVHDSFFKAGADVATTNSYGVLPDRLAPKDLTDRLPELMELACRLACEARDAHGTGLVAGGLGPQGFSYQPDKAPAAEQAAEARRTALAPSAEAPLLSQPWPLLPSASLLRGEPRPGPVRLGRR